MNPIPPPDIPPSIQKPQKSGPNWSRAAAISDSVKAFVAAGMMVWIGPAKFRVVAPPSAWTSPRSRAPAISSKMPERLLPGGPLPLLAEQVLLGHHLQDRADVLGHPAVDEHQAVFEPSAGVGGNAVRAEDGVPRQQPAAADAELRVALGGERPLDQLDPRPHAAGVLPPAAGPAEPLAEDRPRRDQPPLRLGRAARSATSPARSPACTRR